MPATAAGQDKAALTVPPGHWTVTLACGHAVSGLRSVPPLLLCPRCGGYPARVLFAIAAAEEAEPHDPEVPA
jgi:hypothetical protein